jgi:hypothetical protein
MLKQSLGMSPKYKTYKVQKRLTKTIKRLFVVNKGLTPQLLLEANIQTSSGWERFTQGFFGIALIILSFVLFSYIEKENALSLAFIPIGFILIPAGGYLIYKSLYGKKKKIKEYLKEVVNSLDIPIDAINSIDITRVVENAFKESSTKFKGGGGEFGGGGASGEWSPSETHIDINIPDISENLEIGLSNIPISDIGDTSGELASGIIEGIFSSISI